MIHVECTVWVPQKLAESLVDLRFAYSDLLCNIYLELERITQEQQKNLAAFLRFLLHEEIPPNCDLLTAFGEHLASHHTSLFNIYYLKKFSSKLPENIK